MALSLQKLILGRRSVSAFLPELPKDFDNILSRAIDAARFAPNHKRTEPWMFYRLGATSHQRLSHLVYTNELAKGNVDNAAKSKAAKWERVPCIVGLTSKTDTNEIRSLENYAATCCAAQNFMLSLTAAGLGSKWVTGAMAAHQGTRDLLWVSGEERVVGLFWVGQPAITPPPPAKLRNIQDILINIP